MDRDPPEMSLLQQVDDHLARSLQVVAETLESRVEQSLDEDLRLRLRARHTMWVRRADLLLRLPVDHGEERPQDAEKATCDAVRDADDRADALSEGPVGRAFLSGDPVVLAGLPPWSGPGADPDSYRERWVGLGVPRDEVDRFSRHARCILALPMVLDPRVARVLCIDLREPLDEIQEHLDDFCRWFLAASGSLVAALLLARER